MAETKNFDLVIGMFVRPAFPAEVPGMTMEERAEFIKGLLDGSVFSSRHIHDKDKARGDLGKVFLPQGMGAFENVPLNFLNGIGVLWEFNRVMRPEMHKGSATGVSYPVFSTCRLCSKLDWDLACDTLKCLRTENDVGLQKVS